MNFDDLLALIAGVLVVILLIIINFKSFTSNRKVVTKIIFSILTLLLSLPFWYLIQFIITFTLAYITPENKIVNCIYLNEINCKKRPDCQLSYPIGGLGKEIKPMCINKGRVPFEQNNP